VHAQVYYPGRDNEGADCKDGPVRVSLVKRTDPISGKGRDGEEEQNMTSVKGEYPALCQRCKKLRETTSDHEVFVCGLMVEAMNARVPVLSCGYFEEEK